MNIEVFQNCFLFAGFTDEVLTNILSFSNFKTLSQGEMLFEQENEAKAFFVIQTGQVKVFKLSFSGDEQILHIHEPGDVIAEAAIFGGKVYPAFCQATQPSQVLAVRKEPFLNFLRNDWPACLALFSSYSHRLREFVKMIEDLTLKDVKQRIIQYLLAQDQKQNASGLVCLTISKRELASLLGTIPETISRVLRHLKTQGLIIDEQEGIRLLDSKKLKKYLKE